MKWRGGKGQVWGRGAEEEAGRDAGPGEEKDPPPVTGRTIPL